VQQLAFARACKQAHEAMAIAAHSSQLQYPLTAQQVLFEWCCEPDSLLSQEFEHQGGMAIRLGLPQFDMSQLSTVRSVIALIQHYVRSGACVFIWFSLPCQPWSSWQYINAAASVAKNLTHAAQELKASRQYSLHMLDLVIFALQQVLGPHVHAAFEWPRGAIAWTQVPTISNLIELLPLRCDFDGCCFGVVDNNHRLIKKPWRVQTNSFDLQHVLHNQLCDQQHLHGQCRGQIAVASALYTLPLVKTIVQAIMQLLHTTLPVDYDDGEDDMPDPEPPPDDGSLPDALAPQDVQPDLPVEDQRVMLNCPASTQHFRPS
jgi:hypothetical protein